MVIDRSQQGFLDQPDNRTLSDGRVSDLADRIDKLPTAVIRYVKVVDIPGNGSFLDSFNKLIYDPFPTTSPIASGGFDLEAIGVIYSVSA